MKLAFIAVAVLLGGCATAGSKVDVPEPVPAATAVAPSNDVAVVERVPFVLGVSSATVEKLGRAQACTGGSGAGLVTEPGPVEVYRMQCEDGKVFMARCELRQCSKM